MKALSVCLCMLFLISFLSACILADKANPSAFIEVTSPSRANAALQENFKSSNDEPLTEGIVFEYVFRSLILRKDSENAGKLPTTVVILSEQDLNDYESRYSPGIEYFTSTDFSKECLVAHTTVGAKPSYTLSVDIVRVFVSENDTIEVEPDIERMNSHQPGIYAYNTDGYYHFFLNIVKINRSDLPVQPTNVYEVC